MIEPDFGASPRGMDQAMALVRHAVMIECDSAVATRNDHAVIVDGAVFDIDLRMLTGGHDPTVVLIGDIGELEPDRALTPCGDMAGIVDTDAIAAAAFEVDQRARAASDDPAVVLVGDIGLD